MKKHNKPIIEAIINSVALALTSYGVVRITTGNYDGYYAIMFGVILEWAKYEGRKRNLW